MGTTEIPYRHKDIIFKSLTEIFANRVLDFYDINTAPIVRAEPANLPTITVQEKTMDFGDYKNIEKTWILSPETLPNIKAIYPHLANVDISKWTNGDFLAYSKEVDERTYAPTTEQASAIKDRNITIADARTLLKDFHSYDTILAQNDRSLKEHIERYYQIAIDYIKHLAKLSEQTKNIQLPN